MPSETSMTVNCVKIITADVSMRVTRASLILYTSSIVNTEGKCSKRTWSWNDTLYPFLLADPTVFTNLISMYKFSLPNLKILVTRQLKVTVICCYGIQLYSPNNLFFNIDTLWWKEARSCIYALSVLKSLPRLGIETNVNVCPLFCFSWSEHSHFLILLFFIFSKSSSLSHSKDRIISRPSPPAVSSLLTWDGSYSSSFQQTTLRASPPLPTGNSEVWKLYFLDVVLGCSFPFWIYYFFPSHGGCIQSKGGKAVQYIHTYMHV